MSKDLSTRQGRSSGFLRRQCADILKGGLPLLYKKIWYLIPAIPFLPLVLLARAIRPFITIRIGDIVSYRIGHFAMTPELYLSERDIANTKERVIDLFFLGGRVANHQLDKMWRRTLRISRFARYAYICNDLVPGGRNHIVPIQSASDLSGVLEKTKVHISFTREEEAFGRQGLKQFGLPDHASFVCAHGRDSGYLDYALPSAAPEGWGYHDYRDTLINTYIPAAEYLANGGYFVFRTGIAVKEPLDTTNPKIIDYANKGRTDFLDIYLGANCHFFICDTAGMWGVPGIYRRPIAWVNYIPLQYAPTWSSRDVFIPKKLWSIERRRFFTFNEILSTGMGRFSMSEQYAQGDIEVVDNTPDEIASLVIEMDQRLNGTWRAAEGDEELQSRFWAMFPPLTPDHVFRSRIGSEFLRQNQELLD